jgi:hypothetical protein
MQRKIFSVLTTIMVAVVILQLSGCSHVNDLVDVIDVAEDIEDIVELADLINGADNQKQIIIMPSEVHTIKPGTPIVVILKSGFRVQGKYLEPVLFPAEEYAASYAKCREQIKKEIVLPELGDTVTIIDKTGKQHELEFLGFDCGTVLTRRKAKAYMESIKNIVDIRGNIIEVEAVRKFVSEGKIPLLTWGIITKNKSGRTQIALEDIYLIQGKKKDFHW